MAYSMSPRDVIRHALYSAIEYEKSYLDACRDTDMDLSHTIACLKDFRRMLILRYGEEKTPMERLGERGEPIALQDLMAKTSPIETPEAKG